jgi:hypothetical protein
MIRFLKNRLKRSKKPVPPESPVWHQTTDIGAARGGDSEGEHRSRKISELIRPMGLIQPWHSDTNHGGGSRAANQDSRIEDQQLPVPNASTLTPGHEDGNASERGQL